MPLGKAVWTNTVFELPSGAPDEWTDALTGGVVRAGSNGSIAVGDVLDVLPVALLVSAAP